MAALKDSSRMTRFADLTPFDPVLHLAGAVGIGVGAISVRVIGAANVRIVGVGIISVGVIGVGVIGVMVIGVGVIDIGIVGIGLISVGAVSPLAPMCEVRSLVVIIFSLHNPLSSTVI
jgi:hypothetical protein